MHGAPVVGLEEPPLVLDRRLLQRADHGGAGVVHPGIDAAEFLLGMLGRGLERGGIGDVGGVPCGAAAGLVGYAAPPPRALPRRARRA